MSNVPLLAVYCLLVLAASLLGGWIPLVVRLTHQRMQIAVSFVSGLMLGVGLLHLVPHALVEIGPRGSVDRVVWAVLAGFLAMFFIERFFCFHHHDAPEEESEKSEVGSQKSECGGNASHVHGQHEHADHGVGPHGDHDLTWSGAAIGLTLHSVLDGVALAASVEAEAHEVGALAGLGTFLVVFCHKPFDSLTLGTLLARGGWSPRWRHAVNAAFALVILLGVAAFHVGLSGARADNRALLAYALAFAAGTFLCIAMSDLLPELQFHHHDRAKLSAALLLGLAVAWSVGLFERHGHDRDHDDDHGHDGDHGHESRSVSPPSVLAPHARALPPP